MTVTTELAKSGQCFEYFLALEGVGWPVNGLSGALSGGFNGAVWTTNDFAGTLATVLGCTVYHGLSLPESISEEIDPRTAAYSPGGLSIEIQDHDDWWLQNLTPRKVGVSTTIYDAGAGVGLHYADRILKLTDGTAYLEDQLIWIGGRELVKLGAKFAIAGDAYQFYPTLRGYLGTQRGSSLRRPEDFCLGHWPVGTGVNTVSRWWLKRRASLWAHVPGEAVTDCEMIWYGRLSDITNPDAGLDWKLSFSGDFMSAASRIHRAVDWRVSCRAYSGRAGHNSMNSESASWGARRICVFERSPTAKFGADGGGLYELAAAYRYRTEPGGTAGMVTAWNNSIIGGDPQATDIIGEDNILRSFVMIDDAIFMMYKMHDGDANVLGNIVAADIVPYAGGNARLSEAMYPNGWVSVDFDIYGDGAKARFLLSNWGNDQTSSVFTVNGVDRRNVIDTLLIFMLSNDREYFLSDTGAGSTATVIQFASSGADADQWIGKALFCMEGAYRWQARTITGNDATSITVSPGFSGAPAAGVEMQVRNSVYDVLPIGWGLGVPAEDVDVLSFERVRDEYLKDCNVGEFILGTEDEINIWEMLVDNICKPYGVLVYFDYQTRKITARYVGQAMPDGVMETYTAIGRGDIIKMGQVRHTLANPIGTFKLTVRAVAERVITYTKVSEFNVAGVALNNAPVRIGSEMGGKTTDIIIRSDEGNNAFIESELDTVKIEALLNSEDDCTPLVGRLLGLVGEYSCPPPVWDPTLDIALCQSLKLGSTVVINWTAPDAPANPYTGTRGWTDVIGRVVRRARKLGSGFGVEVAIELLAAQLIGRVAPAAVVTGKGTDAHGAYFTVENSNFVAEADTDKDWFHFAVGDRLDHRVATGATSAGWVVRAVAGFGSNFVADPTAAADSRVYVDGAIGSVPAAGDYITFAAWSTASNTARMELYSALADATSELDAADPARRYG